MQENWRGGEGEFKTGRLSLGSLWAKIRLGEFKAVYSIPSCGHIMISVAVLVDKDQSPSWQPATVEGVTPQHVDWYFSKLPEERELLL